MVLLAAIFPGCRPPSLRASVAIARSDYGGGTTILTFRRDTSEFHASRMSPFGDNRHAGMDNLRLSEPLATT